LFIAAAGVMALNRHDEALEEIDQALREQPAHLPSRIQLAWALRASGDMARAETLTGELPAKHPTTASLLPLLFGVAKVDRSDSNMERLTNTIFHVLRKIRGQDYADALRLPAKAQVDLGEDEAAFLTTVEAKATAPMKRDVDGYAAFIEVLCS
jgi:tetratricopeptide (TPR) repeat protein